MQRKFISRRSFLKCAGVGAVTAAAAGLLAGCGGSDSSSSGAASSAAPAEPADPNKSYAGVTLYYAATDTEATGPEMQDIVAMVKEKTGINIEFNIIPKADTGEVDKRLVSLQAGDALDIVYGTVAQLKVFYDAGVLEPLDEMASAAGYDIKSVFGDSAPVYDDGQTYGLPAFTDVWCTFINSKVFENAGVEIPSAEGWTWEKYIETAQKLTNLDEEIYGIGKGLLVTLVDRKTRFLCAAVIRSRNAAETRQAIVYLLNKLPCLSISLDNGSEFSEFQLLEKELQTSVYFAEPHKPWQRGTNENTNDILRFFYPKGYDFRTLSQQALQNVVDLINSRPRKCLGWKSPAEIFFDSSVALT